MNQKKDIKGLFAEYAVKAESVEDFCDRYHRRGAYHDRGAEYMAADLGDHKKEFEEKGYTIIPQGSSTSGGIVSYYLQTTIQK